MTNLPSPELALFLKQLPSKPGVYRMINTEGLVLYVGKASDLKKRVQSYFNKQNTGPKTRSLVSQIHRIELSITRTEIEALLLESTLIKTLRPKYNVLLRDDKTYPYIHISSHPEFPRISVYRAKKKPLSGNFFGPYPNRNAVKDTMNTIQKVFKIRNCQDSYFNARSRPCLQYQIKRCTAPCVLYINTEEYKQTVQDAIHFLQGKSQDILEELSLRMEEAVKVLQFEKAAVFRDQIKQLRLVQEQQGMVQLQGDADAIAIEVRPGFACVQCVTIREGQIVADNRFYPSVPEIALDAANQDSDLWQETFEAFISFYYLDTPERIPALLITHNHLTDHKALEAVLSQARGKSCKIQINPRGNKSLWLNFAINNLQLSVADYSRKQETMDSRFADLAQLLGIGPSINRMECFDISHTQGEATIASCVVFDSQGPATKSYRRFNIEGITPGDDYAAMRQAIRRRFKRLIDENALPDILIIDGGKGQVGVAQEVLDDLQVSTVLLLGIAKDPSRKAGLEKLLIAYESKELFLGPESKALHLLQHIRDEAHRFALSGHRNKRQKARLDSSLEAVDGIGPKRRKALLNRFGGLRDLAKAALEEIAKVPGINEALAKRIYEHFHGDSS